MRMRVLRLSLFRTAGCWVLPAPPAVTGRDRGLPCLAGGRVYTRTRGFPESCLLPEMGRAGYDTLLQIWSGARRAPGILSLSPLVPSSLAPAKFSIIFY